MKAKEKADELVKRYYDAFPIDRNTLAIKSAIIAVDEILSIGTQSYFIDYWSEVKNELNSMQ